jgi:hypothetical protein
MKNLITKLTLLLLAFVLTYCAKKPVYTCGKSALINRLFIDSKILSLKSVGIDDTITAFISGSILSKDSTDNVVTIDTLMFSVIEFISYDRKDTIGIVSDIKGKFEKRLIAGTYDISIRHLGYNSLKIKNVKFHTGELKELNVILGQGNSKNIMNAETKHTKQQSKH